MFYYFLAFSMGLAIALQAPINSTLAKSLQGSFLLAAVISFGIGFLCLLVLAFFHGDLNIAVLKSLAGQNWWKFLGGVLGAFFVFGTILLAPKIGLVAMFITVLIGQLIMALILDSLGAFSLEIKAITWQKICGLLTIFAGLIVFFSKELFAGVK